MAALQHIKDEGADTTTLKFLTNTGSGMSEKMTIDKDGNVGIGTNSPISELSVHGKISITNESATPNAPSDGNGYIYTKSDGKLYWRSADLAETDLTGTGDINATTVTITDNESTNEDNAIIFTAGGDVDGGNLGLESDGDLTYNPSTGKITATGFIGELTGNAATATEATNITAVANNSTDETVYLTFVDGATGTQGIETDTGLTYNPSSGILASTNFTGALTGNAATATVATNITAVANNSTDETVYLTFVDGATGTQGIETDTGLTYNPSSGILASTNFTGDLTGNAATATTVTVADTTDTTCSVALFESATGNLGAKSDDGLTYNAGTGMLTATGFTGPLTGNASGSSGSCTGNAATATVATTVTITDNESTNEDNAIIFTAGGGVDGGNLGLESDGDLTYNPSTGKITATGFTSNGGEISYSNGQNATLSVAATGSGTDGKDLTISAGSAPSGSANQNGGDLILSSGGGDGTGTSIMTFNTKVSGTDAVDERMRIHTNGNVGIGTKNITQLSATKCHIENDQAYTDITTGSLGNLPSQLTISDDNQKLHIGSYYTGGVGQSSALQAIDNATPVHIALNPRGGNVSVGLPSAFKGAFHVENHLDVSDVPRDGFDDAGYLATGGTVSTWGGSPAGDVSIYSKLRLWCDNTIIASSDSRIKTNIEELVDDEALIKFRQLKPCKYNYIDAFQRGNDQVYGFLADEVKTILSNAVSTCNNHIPNVYKSALYNNNTITFQEPHNLDTDGNIQLYLPDNTKTFVPYTVGDTLKINIDVSNLSDNEKPSNDLVQDEDGNYLANNIFVYGTEVDDFHRLDKSAIWTTGVAALQEVDRQLQAEKAKTATLETQVADLLARVTALENP